MKKIRHSWILVLAVFLFSSAGCKKYAFHVPDGYAPDTLTKKITIDTSSSRVDSGMYGYAQIFPGLVGAGEPRLQDAPVTLNLKYANPNPPRNFLRINVLPGHLFSSGMYAAPGELVTINVPDGISNLTCQVGIWTDYVNNGIRQPQIYSRQQLYPGINRVRNLFGGHIYIEPAFPLAEPVTLTFSNACKSPDIKPGDDPVAWKQLIQSSAVPWFEMQADKIIFTLPTDKMKTYLQDHPAADPVAVIGEWNTIIRSDFNKWQGLSDTASDILDKSPDLPWRVCLDAIQLYSHPLYPVVATNNEEWLNNIMAVTDINQPASAWDLFYNLGFNNQQQYWTWSTLSTVTSNLFSFERAKRIGIQNTIDLNPKFASTYPSALAYSAKSPVDFVTGTKRDFDIDAEMNSPFKRVIPFMQIFDKLQSADGTQDGYGFITYLYRKARYAKQPFLLNDFAEHNFMYISLCEYTGLDCRLFFQAWAISISGQAEDSMAAKYPAKLNKDIWQYDPFTKTGGNNTVTSLAGFLDRTDWIITADSEEPAEGASNRGVADAIRDNANNTFWHSQWNGAAPPYPHYLLINMNQTQTVQGIVFTQRQSAQGGGAGNRPKHVQIFIGNSPDESSMTLSLEVDLRDVDATQGFYLPAPVSGQYIRLKFTNGQDPNSPFATMAEINAF